MRRPTPRLTTPFQNMSPQELFDAQAYWKRIESTCASSIGTLTALREHAVVMRASLEIWRKQRHAEREALKDVEE